MNKQIVVQNLSFSYQGTSVLSEISFEIAKGEFIGIIGPNGGGKTTLLSLLMGFLRPDRGKILIDGKPPKDVRQKMGWVPQNFHYDKQFPISALEVVLTGCIGEMNAWGRYPKETIQKALNGLKSVDMYGFRSSPFSQLSGGQAQRVLLARALVNDPEILFLDEATAGVDHFAQMEIYRMLKELKGKRTIIMVTHDLKAAVDIVERVFCVEKHLSILSKDVVCDHYALGLYHPPIDLRKNP